MLFVSGKLSLHIAQTQQTLLYSVSFSLSVRVGGAAGVQLCSRESIVKDVVRYNYIWLQSELI